MPLKLKKRGDIWWIIGTVNGRRHRESARTTSRETAEAFRKKTERDLERRAVYGASSFADAVTFYLSQEGDPTFLQPLLDEFGALLISDITPQLVAAFGAKRFPNSKPASLKRVLYTPLNAVINAAFDAGICEFKRFKAPKGKDQPVEHASDDWLRIFFGRAGPRISITVAFITLTAARVTEACNLVVGDLSLDQGFAVLRMTKNGKPRRVILQPELVEMLRRWLAHMGTPDASQPVFGYSGRWSVNQAIERVCLRVNREAGVLKIVKEKDPETGQRIVRQVWSGPPVLPYKSSHKVGRHAFSFRHLSEGKSLKWVQEAGGWSGIAIVNKNYGHMERSAIDDALRQSGGAVLKELGSALQFLEKPAEPKFCSPISDTADPDEEMVNALRERHLPDN